MNLRYCVKCQETFFCDDRPCPICHKKLYYFGRERVSLSPHNILFEYDKKHPYNPLKDYKGVYYIDTFSPDLDSSVLECEDVLKHNSEEPNALFFLSTTFFSRGDFGKAKGYLERLVALEPMDVRPYKHLAEIYFDNQQWAQAIDYYQKAMVFSPGDWQLSDALGRCYLKLEKTKKALSCFVSALKLCDDDSKKADIKQVVRQISTHLEDQVKSK